MAETKIKAELRTEFGKGAARRIRRDDKVPAVLYGRGTEPQHITLPGHDTMMALYHGGANALLSIELDGKSQLALPKQVQRDVLKGFLEHVDLILVKKGEKVVVDIPVHVVGEPEPETLVVTEHQVISVEAEATHIPEYVEISVEGAEVGHQIMSQDLKLPAGSVVQLDDDTLIVNVTHAPTQEELEAEVEELEAEAGVERDESEDEAEGEGEGAEGESEESGDKDDSDRE